MSTPKQHASQGHCSAEQEVATYAKESLDMNTSIAAMGMGIVVIEERAGSALHNSICMVGRCFPSI